MAEAGFGPGVPYLLSFFYRRTELGFRCGIFLSAAPLATTFAGSSSSSPSLPLNPKSSTPRGAAAGFVY